MKVVKGSEKNFRGKMLSPWGKIVKKHIFRVCGERDDVHEHPYDYFAENILLVTRKSLESWLKKEIGEWEAQAIRAVQTNLTHQEIDSYVEQYFKRSPHNP